MREEFLLPGASSAQEASPARCSTLLPSLLCLQALVFMLTQGLAGPCADSSSISEHHRALRFKGSLLWPEWSWWWKTGLGSDLQLTMLDPPGPSKAAIRGQGALQVNARVWHLRVIANRLSIFGHQAESCGWDLWVEQTSWGERVACFEK